MPWHSDQWGHQGSVSNQSFFLSCSPSKIVGIVHRSQMLQIFSDLVSLTVPVGNCSQGSHALLISTSSVVTYSSPQLNLELPPGQRPGAPNTQLTLPAESSLVQASAAGWKLLPKKGEGVVWGTSGLLLGNLGVIIRQNYGAWAHRVSAGWNSSKWGIPEKHNALLGKQSLPSSNAQISCQSKEEE